MGCPVIDEESFDEKVLKAKTPVLVDFYADWCGPCKALAPVLDEVLSQKEGTLAIVKLNVDGAQDVAAEYSVRSIPTLVLFKDGKDIATHTGGLSKSQLLSWIDEHL